MSAIAERIRRLLAEYGLTQGEVAERIGLDASTLSKSLGGTRRFSLVDLSVIADELNVSIH